MSEREMRRTEWLKRWGAALEGMRIPEICDLRTADYREHQRLRDYTARGVWQPDGVKRGGHMPTAADRRAIREEEEE